MKIKSFHVKRFALALCSEKEANGNSEEVQNVDRTQLRCGNRPTIISNSGKSLNKRTSMV